MSAPGLLHFHSTPHQMKRALTAIVLILILSRVLSLGSGKVYCDIEQIETVNGKPLQIVARVAYDSDGYFWFATWNGLHRFDGYDMVKIKPRVDDDSIPVSNRFYDLAPDGYHGFWCIIDNRVYHFDRKTYRFIDQSRKIERKLGEQFPVKSIAVTPGHDLIVSSHDNRWVTVKVDNGLDSMIVSGSRPPFKNTRRHIFARRSRLEGCGIDDIAYAGPVGSRVCVIGRLGDILVGDSTAAGYTQIGKINTAGARLSYFCRSGDDIWLGYRGHLVKVSLGERHYTPLPVEPAGPVKAVMADSLGRRWVATGDGDHLAIYDTDNSLIGYVDRNGNLSATCRPFGTRIYALAEYPRDTFWIGTKPDGVYRLSALTGNRFTVGHCSIPASAYDFAPDRYGRLWIASLDDGLDFIAHPAAPTVAVSRIGLLGSYPGDARRARHLAIGNDSIFVATTRGLLAAPLPPVGNPATFTPRLYTAGADGKSLSGIAVSDVACCRYPVIATETDGLNIATGNPLRFHRLETDDAASIDVVKSMAVNAATGEIVVVGDNLLYFFDAADPLSPMRKMTFGNSRLRFVDGRPAFLPDSSFIIGHSDGAIIVNPRRPGTATRRLPLVFTSVSIQNRPDSILPASTDTIRLNTGERNITLRFAALELDKPQDIDYFLRIDGGEWSTLGSSRLVSLLDLSPGVHTVKVRSTYPDGRIADNVAAMTLIVEPRFVETILARVLFTILGLAAIALAIGSYLYIRRIKRRQQETLDAYLALLQSSANKPDDTTIPAPGNTADQHHNAIDCNDPLMENVIRFVDQHLADPDLTVDQLAAAVAMSRSSITRRMRQLLGVSPAEFIKQSRLKRAAHLLLTTTEPIKNIATDCGFSDLNYFSKCFKATYTITPSAYRKQPHP